MARLNRGEMAKVADRRAKLVEYRRRKVPYVDFYEELGYKTVHDATKDFSRVLQQSVARQDTAVEVYREEQLMELEYLAEEIHKIFRGEHFHVSASGRIAEHPITGEPLLDRGPNLAAADRLLKIAAQVAKLRGMDSPTRLEGVFTIDALNQAIIDAEQQLAALEHEAAEAERTAGPAD
jgi:hypothetical protein